MLKASNIPKSSMRLGVMLSAVLAASMALADTYQWPLTTTVGGTTIVDMDRGSLSTTNFVEVRTGNNHTMARTSSGQVWTWGDDNTYGQLGRGGAMDLPGQIVNWYASDGVTPVATPTITKIAAGSRFSLALASDGNVYWWGSLAGSNRAYPRRIVLPTGPSQLGADIAAGGTHALMVTSRATGSAQYRVYAWGINDRGQCAVDPATAIVTTPTYIDHFGVESMPPLAIAGGYTHSLVVDRYGEVWAFGGNTYGQLGDGTTTDTFFPVQATDQLGSALSGVTTASGGFDHSVLLISGQVWTAGNNSVGQAGRVTGNLTRFQVLPEMSDVVQVSAGYVFNLAVTSTDVLYSWGCLPRTDKMCDDRLVPMLQPGLTGISVIAANNKLYDPNAPSFKDEFINKIGGFSIVIASGSTPLIHSKETLNSSGTVVKWLTGGASGYVRVHLDQAVTDPAGLDVTLVSASSELLFPSPTGTVPSGSTYVDIPITTVGVATKTEALFTIYQGADWSIAERAVTLRAPNVVNIAVANTDPAMASIKGGEMLVTATLNYPAPSSGLVVPITSNKPDVIPSFNVTFAPGTTEATETVAVTAVSALTIVRLSAITDVTRYSKDVRVLPPMFKLSLLNPTLKGGSRTTLTITLDSPAPSGFTGTIAVTDALGAPSTLASVTPVFPAGDSWTNADLPVSTSPVSVKTKLFIVVTMGPTTKKIPIYLTP